MFSKLFEFDQSFKKNITLIPFKTKVGKQIAFQIYRKVQNLLVKTP